MSTRLAEIPAWARVAAAMLFLGISAAVANLNVTYDQNGLVVRTGWMSPAPAVSEPIPAPWRADLTALEQQLRTAIQALPVQTSTPEVSQEAVLRRVRALVEESEQRQQRELALRIAEVDSHVQAQRLADLRNIDRTVTALRSNTGVDMMRLYNMNKELAVKVSQSR